MATLPFHTYQDNNEQLKVFDEAYAFQKSYLPPRANKRPKRKPKSERICRFCGKKHGETSFRSNPHIISNLFGNNSGYSDFECDRCNNHFSAFESSTADFLGIYRTIFALGKESVPTYKAPDGSIEARQASIYGENAVEISAKIPGLISGLNDTGRFEMQFKTNSYIPLSVYKSLLKIALTTLPEEEVQHYQLALQFLMTGSNTEHFANRAKQVFKSELGFEVIEPYVFHFKKKDIKSKLPTHIFQLFYQDSCLQFHLPYYALDQQPKIGEEITIPMCPPLINVDIWPEGSARYQVLDLSSDIKKVGEINKMYMNFDKDDLARSIAEGPVSIESATDNFDPSEVVKVIFARDKLKGLG